MRSISVINGNFNLSDEVDLIYEKRVSKFGTSAKIDCQKKYIGRRVYVIILKEGKSKKHKVNKLNGA